jgi:CRP-like cAMP-binding protein
MHFIGDIPSVCADRQKMAQEAIQSFTAELQRAAGGLGAAERELSDVMAEVNFQEGDLAELFRANGASEKLWLVKKGALRASWNGQLAFLYEVGDLLPVAGIGSDGIFRFEADTEVELINLSFSDLFKFLSKNSELLGLYLRATGLEREFHLSAIQALSMGALPPEIETISIEAHKSIISEGDVSTDVYHMVEGSANVVCQGMQVGTVGADQIFGALAALTGFPRTASVITKEPCLVMKIPQEQFLELVRSRPATVVALVTDMAMALATTNKRVVEMAKLKG